MPYCRECGTEVGSNSQFCPECGTELQAGSSETTEDEETETQVPDSQKSGLRHRFPGISKKNTTRRNVLVGVGYTILGLGVIGAAAGPQDEGANGGSGGESDGQYSNAWFYNEETGILIENPPEAEIDQIGSMYIRGTAVNESGQNYEYVQLSFSVLDSSGAKIADGLANTSGLEAGQRWRFEALAPSADGADSYELADVTAY